MNGIGIFLERYKNFIVPSRAISRGIVAAILEILGTLVDEKDVQVTRGIARITLGGALKSEILLHKEEILAAASTKVGGVLKDII